eukprot:59272-Chlamydomonas_euryale.AAC.3
MGLYANSQGCGGGVGTQTWQVDVTAPTAAEASTTGYIATLGTCVGEAMSGEGHGIAVDSACHPYASALVLGEG